MEKTMIYYVQDLIIDTVDGTEHLETTIHNTALSHKKISQIKNYNTTNILHEKLLHVIKHS